MGNYPANIKPEDIDNLYLPPNIVDHPPTNELHCGSCGEVWSVDECLEFGWYTEIDEWSEDIDGIKVVYDHISDEERLCPICVILYLALIV